MNRRRLATLILCGVFLWALAAPLLVAAPGKKEGTGELRHAEDLFAVDCLLPAQVRRLGRMTQIVGPRKAIKTTAFDCRIRGGEYTENRGDHAFALQAWLPAAKGGDAEAQTFVGEIYEKGVGGAPDYAAAAAWYRKAAGQGSSRAAMSLGYLHEKGLGVPKDLLQAVQWYRKASGLPADMIALSGEDDPPVSKEPSAGGIPTAPAAPAAIPADVPVAGPAITLIDPQLTGLVRGTRTVMLRGNVAERELIGRLTAPAGLLSFLINDKPLEVGADGLFRISIPVSPPRSPVALVAVDRRGQRASLDFELISGDSLAPPVPTLIPSDVDWGGYYAVVIGNNNYTDPDWNQLVTAVNDARDVAEVLRTKYGFTVRLIENATRSQLMNALEDMRETLTKKDNLIVYYAGHGTLEKDLDRAYWIPVDGGKKRMADWISLDQITDQLELIPAKQVLLIADSCYSGKLTRSGIGQLRQGMTWEDQIEALKRLSALPARLAFTSGGVQTVSDEGGDGHSVFAKELLHVLETNEGPLLANDLYTAVRGRVTNTAGRHRVEQVPRFSPIRNSRHAGGDFVLVPVPPPPSVYLPTP